MSRRGKGAPAAQPEPAPLPAESRISRTWLIALVVFILLVSAVRLRNADVPLERDEGEYAYMGQLILEGIPPYQLAYNMKWPGTYYAYAVILAAFGQTVWGVHVGLLVVNVATILLLFFLAHRLLRDSMAAAVAAMAFGTLSVDRWIMGIFGHATHFVVVFALAGLLVLFRALQHKKTTGCAAAGVLLGVSVLMKQHGLFFLAAGIVWIVVDAWLSEAPRVRSALVRSCALVAGATVPFAMLCVLLYAQGVFDKFWFWTMQYGVEYVSQAAASEAWGVFVDAVVDIAQANAWIWLMSLAGGVMLWSLPWPRKTRWLLTSLTLAALVALCPGWFFRQHYFILILPAAGLLCGVAVLSTQRLLNGLMAARTGRAVACAVFVAAVGAYAYAESDYLWAMSPERVSRERYGANPFVESQEISRYLRDHTDASDRIAVLGSEPQIYFYTNRKSATGYIYTYALMEQQPYSGRMQEEMIQEITTAHPAYIVYVGVPSSWLVRNPQERILTWAVAYLERCYDAVGVADILPGAETQYVWDAAVATYKPRSPFVVYTLKRKSTERCAASP